MSQFNSAHQPLVGQLLGNAGSHPLENPQVDAPRLLRVHVIGANFANTQTFPDPYVIVSVPGASAQTKVIAQNKTPIYDDQFIIEYATENTEVSLTAHDNKFQAADPNGFLGGWNSRVGDLNEGSTGWFNDNQSITLNDRMGKDIGTINFRTRRESKIIGKLHVTVNNIALNPAFLTNQTEPVLWDAVHIGKTTPVYVSKPATSSPSQQFLTYLYNSEGFTADVNQNNNAHDLFIEIRQGQTLLGESRVTLWDAYTKKVPTEQVIENARREKIGTIGLTANLEGNAQKK